MKRLAPLLFGLLLACSPPSDDAPPSAAPAERAPAAPRSPKPAQERAVPKRGKTTLQANGSYFQYVDESGHVRFAPSLDAVPERQRSTAEHIPLAPPAAPRQAAAPRREEAAELEVAPKSEVVLYTTASCPYCKRAIAYLDQIGQDYENRNVERDPEARSEYLKLTHGRAGVPVIVVGRQWMQGWSQERLEQMLADAH
ncbi:MAG: glutaredoxin family protein [Myxococcota bacterium]